VGRTIEAKTWKQYETLRRSGLTQADAARQVGISERSAKRYDNGDVWTDEIGKVVEASKVMEGLKKSQSPPKREAELSSEARRALVDFEYFRQRYLGRDTKPWQNEAARLVVELLATDEREWAVINVPPGSGKSTTFTHDIPLWLIARNRGERILIGSRTQRQATQYGRRLRSSLMRQRPAEGALATLSQDFGQFQPPNKDLWRAEEFIVWEDPNVPPSDEKEPTVMCAGMDTGFLGGRFRFCIWDDLVDKSTIKTSDARQSQQEWYDDEAETRLEPGGLFLLQGQRLSPDDLYRYALDKPGIGLDGEPLEGVAKYRHIVFPGHDESRCKEQHGRDAPAWPDGCLLDPHRLSWRDLMSVKAQDPRRYRIIIQQEDVDPAGALIPLEFVEGGMTPDGVQHPGCLDHDRSFGELPESVDPGECSSVISVDPSPTQWWAVEWWMHHSGTGQRYLLDMTRDMMDAPDFLDRLHDGRYVGLLVDMVESAIEMGMPIEYLIVEANAAQRFMMQYEYFESYLRKHGISLVPHTTTGLKKAHEEFGVQSLRPHYQFGRVRLPYGDLATKNTVDQFVKELTTWPHGKTDDTVMAQWFFEWNLDTFEVSRLPLPHRAVPSFLRKRK